MLHYPLRLTWAQIAELPGAADAFCWDPSMIDEDTPDLAAFIAVYATAYHNSPHLKTNLEMVGYLTDPTDGIDILDRACVAYAGELFYQITDEYDRIGQDPMPTWVRFSLGGDDDVDYCGGQPSCLTDLLLSHMKEGSDHDQH